jgi:hypothetical protein
MKTKLILFILLMLTSKANAQLVGLSISLGDSCIDPSKQTNPIEITVSNPSQKNYWIDIQAISILIYQGDKIVEAKDPMTIEFLSPGEHIKNGFLFVEKLSNVTVNKYSSIFKNYSFEKGAGYQLKAQYINPRKKIFKRIYSQVIDLGYSKFSICK